MRGLRKLKVFLLFLLVLDLIIIPIISAHSHLNNNLRNTIIVSKIDGHYSNIQEAINHAKEGSIILIKTGVYSEILDIKKKITIIGENKYTTIINPISKENKYAIKLSVPDITIKNFSISNRASGLYTTGLRISADKSKIINCNFYDNPIGIAIFSSDNQIYNCNFWNCKDEGIAMIGTKISKCDFNIISNCTMFNNCDGIELQFSSNNVIENCTINNNTHSGIDAIISSNDENIFKNCNIFNNKVNGIYLSSSSNNEIIDCNFWNNNDGNIIITEDSSNNIILDNQKIKDMNIHNSDNIFDLNDEVKLNSVSNSEIIINKNFNTLIEMILDILPFLKTLLKR